MPTDRGFISCSGASMTPSKEASNLLYCLLTARSDGYEDKVKDLLRSEPYNWDVSEGSLDECVASWIDSECQESYFRYRDQDMEDYPLHRAVKYEWPVDIIRRVADGYPETVAFGDYEMMTPLHEVTTKEVAQLLYPYAPHAMKIRTEYRNCTPLHMMARHFFTLEEAIRDDPSLCLEPDHRDHPPIFWLTDRLHPIEDVENFIQVFEQLLVACPKSASEDMGGNSITSVFLDTVKDKWSTDAEVLTRILRLLIDALRSDHSRGPIQVAIGSGVPFDLCLEMAHAFDPESVLFRYIGMNDQYEGCPLEVVVRSNRLELFEPILRIDPEVLMIKTSWGGNVIDFIADCSQAATLLPMALEAWSDCLRKTDDSGEMVLHRLCKAGRCRAVGNVVVVDAEQLLIPDKLGNLPLHLLCSRPWIPTSDIPNLGDPCEILDSMTAGRFSAALAVENQDGMTPVHLAVRAMMRAESTYAVSVLLPKLLESRPDGLRLGNSSGDPPLFTCEWETLQSPLVHDQKFAFDLMLAAFANRRYCYDDGQQGRLFETYVAMHNKNGVQEIQLKRLLKEFPDGAQYKNNRTNEYLLHRMIKRGADDCLLRYVLDLFPKAAAYSTKEKYLPLHLYLELGGKDKPYPEANAEGHVESAWRFDALTSLFGHGMEGSNVREGDVDGDDDDEHDDDDDDAVDEYDDDDNDLDEDDESEDNEAVDFLEKLIRAHPDALRHPAPDGSMPFYMAASSGGSVSVIYRLLRETPDALETTHKA